MLQNTINSHSDFRVRQREDLHHRVPLRRELQFHIEASKIRLAEVLQINSYLVQQINAIRQTEDLNRAKTQSNNGKSVQSNKGTNVKIEFMEDSSSEIDNQNGRNMIKGMEQKERQDQLIHDKNQTKNIPKNYGKAILSYIQKNIQKHHDTIKPILHRGKLTVGDLLLHIKKHKREVNSINYLKQMWGISDRSHPIFKCIRILSHIFMRKHCLSYIFNSRIKNYSTHIKYRNRIIQGIQHPEDFTCIKQF